MFLYLSGWLLLFYMDHQWTIWFQYVKADFIIYFQHHAEIHGGLWGMWSIQKPGHLLWYLRTSSWFCNSEYVLKIRVSLIPSQWDLHFSVAYAFLKILSSCMTSGEQEKCSQMIHIRHWEILFSNLSLPFVSTPRRSLQFPGVWLPSSDRFQQGTEALGLFPLYPRKDNVTSDRKKGVNATLKWL